MSVEPQLQQRSKTGPCPGQALSSEQAPGWWFALGAILVIFLGLAGTQLLRTGVGIDEVTDLSIAASYHQSWLRGASWDPTQARLPMFLVYALSVAAERLNLSLVDLWLARSASVLMGLVCLAGCFACGRELRGMRTGVLACLVLGLNPFFLGYTRVALTESGVYEAALGIWFCYFLIRLRFSTLGEVCALGVCAGFMVSAKFSAGVLLPLGVLKAWWSVGRAPDRLSARLLFPVALGILLLLVSVGLAVLVQELFSSIHFPYLGPVHVRIWYGVALVCWGGALWLLWRQATVRVPWWMVALLLAALSVATVWLFPPQHFGNGRIISSSFLHVMHPPYDRMPIPEKTVLFLAFILLKSSPLLGAALILSGPLALMIGGQRKNILFLLAVAAGWLLVGLRIDWLQVFYVLPVLPILSVLLAWVVTWGWETGRRWTGVGLAVILCGTLVDVARSFPDYRLNGCQYLGGRPLFQTPPLGSAAVGTIGYDGIDECLRFVAARAQPGSVVVSYLPFGSAEHVVKYVVPHRSFTLIDGTKADSAGALDQADYVLTTLELEEAQRTGVEAYPMGFKKNGYVMYDRAVLERDFVPVWTVRRAFGLTVATVWGRPSAVPTHAEPRPHADPDEEPFMESQPR